MKKKTKRYEPVPDMPETTPGSSLRLALVFLLPLAALVAWAALHG